MEVVVDGKKLLTDLNLAVRPGSKVLIVGDNGSGKTVLLKTMLGIYRPSNGEVRYGDAPVEKICSESTNKLLAYDPVERMLFLATIVENVNMYTDGEGYGAEELRFRLRE